MRDNQSLTLPKLAMLLLLAVGLPARAACTAGNPSANVIESTPTSGFADNGNGTVTHSKTGLMWKRCAEGQSWNGSTCIGTATTTNWSNALKAANTANGAGFAGYTDWRLPNQKELESIVEFCGYNPSINLIAFPAMPASGFWSASSHAAVPSNAWLVDFYHGRTDAANKAFYGVSVRLVRGGQFVDSFDLLNPASISPSDCVFDLAERLYPNLFAPAAAVSQTLAPYYYRYYAGTNSYLATSSTDNHLYYLGPATGSTLYDAGPLSVWQATAGCP